MKKIIYTIVFGLLIFSSCKPTETELFENKIQNEEVKMIKLTSDHNLLLPDGKAQMEFRCESYGIKDIKVLVKKGTGANISYTEEIKRDTFLIPKDRISPDFIKVYLKDGTVVPDKIFKTTNQNLGNLEFYAQGGSVKSESLNITIRPLPADEIEEIVYPVIFHLLVPPASNRPAYSISSAQLQEKLDQLNSIYNRKNTTNPNGASAKITFKLAIYDPKGKELVEQGKEVLNVAANLTTQQYKDYINTAKVWDPNKYLNIYVCKFADNYNDNGTTSYLSEAPKVIFSSAQAIPGIAANRVSTYAAADVKDFSEAAIMLNYGEFFNPTLWNANNPLELATIMGYYLGLKPTRIITTLLGGVQINPIVNGDTDYCPDTYVYEANAANFTIYKTDYFNKNSFTSFNIMTEYGRKNSITVDQVSRLRSVVERCPSRWSYKSNWAFTGK